MPDTPQKLQGPRLAVVLPHLGLGGAQRVAATLVNHWAEQGLDVHVITTLEHKVDFYELNPAVNRLKLRKCSLEAAPRSESVRKVNLRGESAFRTYLLRVLHHSRQNPAFLRVATETLRHEKPWRIFFLRACTQITLRVHRGVLMALRRASKPFRGLPHSVAHYCINNQVLGDSPRSYMRLMRASMWRVRALRQALIELEPDVVLSFLGSTNIITIASARDLPTLLVISERNDPARQELARPWQSLRPIIYPVADIVTANSHGAIEQMRGYCSAAKLAYVPNPVVLPPESESNRCNSILFLARLVHQKAPDVLVDAFAQFTCDNPDWTLQIAGDGPMEQELMERVRSHRIEDKVVFHGMVKDPVRLLLASRIFVLPSRFEGTPNSLLEAMSARLACIVTDASPGPLRLVEHEVSGLVVKTDEVDDLARALHRLARDPALCQQLAHGAWERTTEFHLENVIQDWSRLLFPGAANGGCESKPRRTERPASPIGKWTPSRANSGKLIERRRSSGE